MACANFYKYSELQAYRHIEACRQHVAIFTRWHGQELGCPRVSALCSEEGHPSSEPPRRLRSHSNVALAAQSPVTPRFGSFPSLLRKRDQKKITSDVPTCNAKIICSDGLSLPADIRLVLHSYFSVFIHTKLTNITKAPMTSVQCTNRNGSQQDAPVETCHFPAFFE